ncbi:MAG: glycosyltransferase family 2 protein [Bacteroidota bacterium]
MILPVFNREKRISRAIQSVIDQEFENWELIVINDASTDGTKEILDQIKHSKINIIHNVTNLERCASRNLGIDSAKGEFICFLDSDDYHLPEHLKKLHELIESKKFQPAFYFSNSFNETEEGSRTERCCPEYTKDKPYHYFLNYTVNPQRWAVHHSIFEKVKFDPDVIICEDMDTSMRIVAANFPVYQLNERTTIYVAAADSFTHGDSQKWEKELFYLKRIFNKKELQGKLPLFSRWRLLSMCYFHLAEKANLLMQRQKAVNFALKSIAHYPKGYNKRTFKPLIVILAYNLPLLGNIFQKSMKNWKQKHLRVI